LLLVGACCPIDGEAVLRGTAPEAEVLSDGDIRNDGNDRPLGEYGPRRPDVDKILIPNPARRFAAGGRSPEPAALAEVGIGAVSHRLS